MNRQTRRHPTHPALPILYPSKESILSKNDTNTRAGFKQGKTGKKNKKGKVFPK